MQVSGPVLITVRDGRAVRDMAGLAEGDVLMEFKGDRMYAEGDRLRLPDQTEVEVVGVRETFSTSGVAQTLFVGDVL